LQGSDSISCASVREKGFEEVRRISTGKSASRQEIKH
jgi:hypothetical protein